MQVQTFINKHLRIILFLLLFSALALRLYKTDWDLGYYTHPDEAHIYNVVYQLEIPSTIEEAISIDSPLNPHFFAYGSFPLYLLKGISAAAGIFEPSYAHYGNLYKIGRPLSAIFDIGTLILLILISKKLFDTKKIALVAGGLYATTVFAIQNAHFYIVDTQLTFWMFATITALTYGFIDKSKRYILLGAVTTGFAVATKFSGVTLIPIVALASLIFPFINSRETKSLLHKTITALGFTTILALLILCLAIILQPYILIDFETFKENLTLQLTMSRDATIFPYTLQYIGTGAYTYALQNILQWGIGLSVGIAAIIGIIAITFRTVLTLKKKELSPLLFVSLFFWGTFLTLGASAVKFMRYFLPLYPILILGAALVIVQILKMERKQVRAIILVLIIAPHLWWTGAFLSVYYHQHPWVTASNWMHDHIPSGTTIAVEHWDRSLPLYNAHRFKTEELQLYVPDSREKVSMLVDSLFESKYIIISSNRIYDSIPNIPERYPATLTYYDLLFDEKLGFIKKAEFSSYPSFLGVEKNDQSADESFSVYDHPRVQIFEKQVFNKNAVAEILYNSL